MIMLHGRGATAGDILSLALLFEAPGIAYLAPQAVNNTWYPYPFMTSLERNEPWLSSALERVDQMAQMVSEAGIGAGATYLLGFSQGACLALEYAARHAQRYAGVFGLSGGLIGPDDTSRDYPGTLKGTPVFLGCSDVDFHIPKERASETAEVLKRMGADVTLRFYPNMGHEVNQDELDFVRGMMMPLLAAREPE
jgi:predicted esterase